jgi:hypothetical protein
MSSSSSEAAFEAQVLAKMAKLKTKKREAAYARLIEEEAQRRIAKENALERVKELRKILVILQGEFVALQKQCALFREQGILYEQHQLLYKFHRKRQQLEMYKDEFTTAAVDAGIRVYKYDYPTREMLVAAATSADQWNRYGEPCLAVRCSCGTPAGIWKPDMAYPPRCSVPKESCGKPGYNIKMKVYGNYRWFIYGDKCHVIKV